MIDGLCGAHHSAALAIAALSEVDRAALYEAAARHLQTHTDDGVMFPMTGALVVARKT